jgi:hypothetical protein
LKSLKSDLKDPPVVPDSNTTTSGSGVPSVNISLNYVIYVDTTTRILYLRLTPPNWTAMGKLLSLL